jgi:hypothetical protein
MPVQGSYPIHLLRHIPNTPVVLYASYLWYLKSSLNSQVARVKSTPITWKTALSWPWPFYGRHLFHQLLLPMRSSRKGKSADFVFWRNLFFMFNLLYFILFTLAKRFHSS